MSLPPTTVQIKRKRTDEPVDFLRIQETNGKRQRTIDGYIFERQPPLPTTNTPIASQPGLVASRAIKPLHRSSSTHSLVSQNETIGVIFKPSQELPAPDAPFNHGNELLPSSSKQTLHTNTHNIKTLSNDYSRQPRRFHIARTTEVQGTNPVGQVKRSKDGPIVFMERRVNSRKTVVTKGAEPIVETVLVTESSSGVPRKRPGKHARTQVPPSSSPATSLPSTNRKPEIPQGLRNRWNVTPEQLAKEMEAYTLQTIGHKLAEQEAQRPASKDTRSGQGLNKFRPKVPAQRYAERHPEQAVGENADTNMEYEMTQDHSDSEDFITETYIRVPLGGFEESYNNVGLLILDSQPDRKEFYGDSEDSEEDEDYEEEDENAENHYSADYPDEEVDSDDEFGRNAYNYRNNASDEEFDDAYSDSGDDFSRPTWKYQSR